MDVEASAAVAVEYAFVSESSVLSSKNLTITRLLLSVTHSSTQEVSDNAIKIIKIFFIFNLLCKFIKIKEHCLMPFIDFHTYSTESEDDVLKIVNYNFKSAGTNEGYYSAGVHPKYIDQTEFNVQFKEVQDLISSENCKVVGECGLDLFSEASLQIQKLVFESHIKLGIELKKPLLVHCVRRFPELIQSFKKLRPGMPVIIHGFNNSSRIYRQYLEKDFYISFGPSILRSDYPATDLLKIIELGKVFLETDEEAVSVKDIYRKFAEIRGVSLELLKKQIEMNFENVMSYGR
jgi:TatD DNase family protein